MRKTNSIKNLLSNIIPFIILTILGFFRVNVLLKYLGVEIFSLNQLFFQIFAYISLAEGGIGALINQQYYKLIATKDKKKINELYTSSKKLFNNISIIIFTIGFILSFFLKYFTNNNLSPLYMQIVFILFIVRAIMEYVYYPPRIIMQADQKMYKTNIIYNSYRILEMFVDIIALLMGANYIIILLLSSLIRFIMYNHMNKKVFGDYPWLKITKTASNIKIKGIKDMMAIKFAGVANENTDIVLISTFLTPLQVTIYASYNYIIKFLNDLAYMIYSSILASFGNVINKENQEYSIKVFEEINFLFLIIAVIFSTITFSSINSFISLWIGRKFIVSNLTLCLFVLLLFYNISKRSFLIQRDAAGLFKETSKINVIESLTNIIISLLLVKEYGIKGVLFGSILASLFTNFWFMPKLVYKQYKLSPYKYFGKFFYHLFLSIFISYIGQHIYKLLNINNLIIWIFYTILFAIINIIIIVGIEYILFKPFRSLIKKIINTIFRKDNLSEKNI